MLKSQEEDWKSKEGNSHFLKCPCVSRDLSWELYTHCIINTLNNPAYFTDGKTKLLRGHITFPSSPSWRWYHYLTSVSPSRCLPASNAVVTEEFSVHELNCVFEHPTEKSTQFLERGQNAQTGLWPRSELAHLLAAEIALLSEMVIGSELVEPSPLPVSSALLEAALGPCPFAP